MFCCAMGYVCCYLCLLHTGAEVWPYMIRNYVFCSMNIGSGWILKCLSIFLQVPIDLCIRWLFPRIKFFLCNFQKCVLMSAQPSALLQWIFFALLMFHLGLISGLTMQANVYYKLLISWTNQKVKDTYVTRNTFDFKHGMDVFSFMSS